MFLALYLKRRSAVGSLYVCLCLAVLGLCLRSKNRGSSKQEAKHCGFFEQLQIDLLLAHVLCCQRPRLFLLINKQVKRNAFTRKATSARGVYSNILSSILSHVSPFSATFAFVNKQHLVVHSVYLLRPQTCHELRPSCITHSAHG